jgi:2-amino-4-hydroxy-6-hydroxymethyldihydropteridine diphosphokinase
MFNQQLHGVNQVAIALGSNLGNSLQLLKDALDTLAAMPHFTLLQSSRVYRTVAVGPPQPDYLNASAILATEFSPHRVLQALLEVESQFGRVRREKWGPRLLDLDLLLFDDLVLDLPHLQIPHPRMNERAFVLVPLAEIAPNWIDPISGKAIADLQQGVDCSGVTCLNSTLHVQAQRYGR